MNYWCLLLAILSFMPGQAFASLYWEQGIQSNRPTVCFSGDASAKRADRIAQIQQRLKWFEDSANIRFQYQPNCISEVQQDGTDKFTADIRVAIPGTSYGAVTDLFNAAQIPGSGCRDKGGGGGWSAPPGARELKRTCLYNLHLGEDAYLNNAYVAGSQPLGSSDGGSIPYLNHTLHEFGHALGLSHEHDRFDVYREWVIRWLKQIASVTDTDATNIYNVGYRSVSWVAGTDMPDANLLKPEEYSERLQWYENDIASLQRIPGYETRNEAIALKDAARVVRDTNGTVAEYGGGGIYYLSPYDPLSVMHYTWMQMQSWAPGNYANTGLSYYDRLALHILYPEDVRVAEFLGTTVVKTSTWFRLDSLWKVRGADISKTAKNFIWEINGFTYSASPEMVAYLAYPGNYQLEIGYTDFLNRNYYFSGTIRVLTTSDFNRKILTPIVSNASMM